MAKFNNIGYVAKSQKDPKKSYIKLTQDIAFKKGDVVHLFEPRKGKNDTDEKFEEIKQWKRFDIVKITDDDV